MRPLTFWRRALAMLMLPALCVHAAAPPRTPATAPQPVVAAGDRSLVAEARGFMAGYAAALLRGDPVEIAAHYDRDGVYEVRPAQTRFTSHEALSRRYRERWTKPAIFEWRELSYEVLSPDKVLVVGRFVWAASAQARPQSQSYVAVLRKHDGRLQLRLEAEAWQDGARWSTLVGVALASSAATLLAVWLLRTALRWRRRRVAQSRSSAT